MTAPLTLDIMVRGLARAAFRAGYAMGAKYGGEPKEHAVQVVAESFRKDYVARARKIADETAGKLINGI